MKTGHFASCRAPLLACMALAVAMTASVAETPAPPAPATPAPTPAPAAPAPAAPAPAAPAPATPAEAAAPHAAAEMETLKPADLAPRPALVIHSSANWEDGYAKIREGIEKLRAAAQKAGLKPVDHGMAAFTETDDAGFKFDAILPVEPGAKPSLPEGIILGESPAGKAIKFTHTGSYDDIDTTYDAITAYLDEKGLEATNIYLEDYLVEGKDASDQALKADIYVFLK
ncbi:effector-binding domain-containing protein [Rhodoblastus acidophilus]|uniref:GyrI-like domain-containing protein n=1 Tax=Rhodoblastus acidophilus TaxID=1074 RepID=UPI0022258792|nr:GyrI-like domain-containing protein [Rhodoblastus acidophilus]MCW2284386.1 effector-binding domain-containing protein [Rhodoblastus acidophilus]MCW2333136.1 effector-binding domain-containing protein [Rhodoblastus acidophilus]